MNPQPGRPSYYILVGHEPVPVDGADVLVWAEAMERSGWRKVADTRWKVPDVHVSTVFLGIDHDYSGRGAPVLFETMIFAPGIPEIDEDQRRFVHWDSALAHHRATVAELAGVYGPPDTTMEAP